jgi:Arc/MetJ family transcription regulator
VAENTDTGLPEGVLPEGVIPEALPEGVLPEGVIPETTSAAAPPPAEPPAQPQTDEEYAALMDPMAGTPLSVAAFNAQRGIQHEEVAQAMRYGEALGLDPESLMGDPKALAAAKEEVDFRESIKTLQGAPKLAALLAHNTALAAAAREDLPALNTIEAGVMDVAHGYYARKYMGGDKDAGIRLHDIDRMLSRYDKEEHGLVADVVRMLPTAGAFGAAGVVGAVSVGPVAAPGGALAGPFIYMYQTQAGELYARIADAERAHVERDPSYTPLSQKQMEQAAKKGALTGATIFTLLGNAFNKSLPLANGALQRLGVNIVAEATEDTAVKAALRRLVETGTHGLSGTMAMTAQAISDDATVQKATTGDVDIGKATAAGVETFKRVFFPTLMLGAVEPSRAYLADLGRIRTAPFDVGRLDQMAKMVKSSKMVDRAPEAAEQILGSIVEGSDIETTYIGHEALKNPDVAQAVAAVVGEHAVSEALATQGSVPMATEKYLTQIAPDFHDAVREHLRIDQEGASLAEAREIKPTLFEASFKNKETGEVVETGRFHDITKLPGGENADLEKWEAGFNDAQGKFYTRVGRPDADAAQRSYQAAKRVR